MDQRVWGQRCSNKVRGTVVPLSSGPIRAKEFGGKVTCTNELKYTAAPKNKRPSYTKHIGGSVVSKSSGAKMHRGVLGGLNCTKSLGAHL